MASDIQVGTDVACDPGATHGQHVASAREIHDAAIVRALIAADRRMLYVLETIEGILDVLIEMQAGDSQPASTEADSRWCDDRTGRS